MAWSWSIFFIMGTSMTLTAAVLHILGLIVLFYIKSPISNQNQITIMINLALTEFIFCLNLGILFMFKILNTDFFKGSVLETLNLSVEMFSFTSNKLVMLVIITDRFFDIYLNIKYAVYFTRKRIKYTLFIIWFICALYAAGQGVFVHTNCYTSRGAWTIQNYISFPLDAIILLSAILTYIYFYMKVNAILQSLAAVKNLRSPQNMEDTQTTTRLGMKFLLPFLIIFTYLLCNVTATALFIIRRNYYLGTRHSSVLLQVAWTAEVIGFLSDAVLYVFLQRNVRLFITSLCSKQQQQIIDVALVNTKGTNVSRQQYSVAI